MKGLSGKVALVIGGTRGIGGAISRRLAGDGAALAVVHRSRGDGAADLADDLGQAPLLLRADAGIAAELATALDEVVARLGRVDVLVHVAGTAITGELADYGDDAFDRVFALNVRAPFDAVRRIAPAMPDGGRVILIGSAVADRAPGPGLTLYAASKAALGGMVRGLARDLGPRRITANLVQPGPVDTERNPADGPNAEANRAPLAIRRHGRPEEVAGLVALAGIRRSRLRHRRDLRDRRRLGSVADGNRTATSPSASRSRFFEKRLSSYEDGGRVAPHRLVDARLHRSAERRSTDPPATSRSFLAMWAGK